MAQRSKVGPAVPFHLHGRQGHKIKRIFLATWRSTVGGLRPSPQSNKKGVSSEKRVCPESRCKAQIAVATDYELPGRRQIRQPRLVCGPFGGAGCGKIGPSLTCREGALQGRGGEGRARRVRGDAPRSRDTPWGCGLARRARPEEGQGRREPAGSDGGRTERGWASRGHGR